MKFKNVMVAVAMLSSTILMAQQANAQAKYVGPLNAALGTSGLSCFSCHNGPASSGATATLPMARTYNLSSSAANIANSDSDGDGFTNKQEANGASTAFNSAGITPFSIAKALESSSSTKVVVSGAGIVTETAIAVDPYAQTAIKLTASNEVAGLVAAQITTPSATLTFAKPIIAGSKAYVVDLLAKTNTPITNISYNQNGSVTVAGLIPVADVVVERVLTNYNQGVAGPGGGGDDDDDEGGEGGCLSGVPAMPLMMLLSMLVLGLLARRK